MKTRKKKNYQKEMKIKRAVVELTFKIRITQQPSTDLIFHCRSVWSKFLKVDESSRRKMHGSNKSCFSKHGKKPLMANQNS